MIDFGLKNNFLPIHHPPIFGHKNPDILSPNERMACEITESTLLLFADLNGTSSIEFGTLAESVCSELGLSLSRNDFVFKVRFL